jgi:hypothetical protein
MTSVPGRKCFHDVRRIHRADDDLLHAPPAFRFAVEEVAFDGLANLPERRIGQQRLLGNHAEQFDAEPGETAPREVAHVIDLLAEHLVQNDADDLDVLLVEERLVERDFVDRFANAAARHEDDLAFEQPRHARIREIEHAADTGVPRAFDNHEILFPRRAIERVLNALHEMLVVGLLDVAPREIRLDGDRAHRFERRVNANV